MTAPAAKIAPSPAWSVTGPGTRWGRWTVLEIVATPRGKMARVTCDCGAAGVVDPRDLVEGNSSGCNRCRLATKAGTRRVTRKVAMPSYAARIEKHVAARACPGCGEFVVWCRCDKKAKEPTR